MAGDCILCGKCLEVCPLLCATGREELAPRAKADLCRMLERSPEDFSEADAARLAGLCLGCGRCKEVCSQGVDVPALVAGLRAAHPDFKSWLWKTWLTRARLLWGTGSTAAKCIPERFQGEKLGPMLKALAGLKGGPGLEPFLEITSFPETYKGEKMLLFAGCTATYVQSRWLMTALRLLDGLGVDVLPGDFKCCGGGLKAAGFAEEAHALEEHNAAVWRKAGKPHIVTFCASCRAGLEGYACFDTEKEQKNWRESIFSLSSCLLDAVCMVSPNVPKTLGYHHPCHAGNDDRDAAFLEYALGGRIHAQTTCECCGFGGVMGLAAPGLTGEANTRCWDALRGVDTVLTGCSACVTRLKATAPEGVAVGHWLEIIK